MSKIKLVHFTSSLQIGGAERVLFDLITHLDNSIYEHSVVYIHDGPYRNRLEDLGIKTYCVRGLLFRYDPWLFVRLRYLFKKLKPDVIHTLLWSANVAGRLVARGMRIPCITVLHNNCEQNGFMRNSIDKIMPYMHETIVAVSQEVKQSAVRHLWISAHKIKVITNGVHLNKPTKQITRSMLGLSPEHFIIGSVGRFHSIKRYDLLLKTFAQVVHKYPHARLMLLGLGSLEQELRALADRLNIVHLVTFVIGQPAQNYYHLFDCFVQTSAQEGISIALLEAMHASLPCIVMNIKKEHSVITHNSNGLLILASDTKALIQAIEDMITNQKLTAQLGIQAKKDVEAQFTLDQMINKYAMLFNSAIKGLI